MKQLKGKYVRRILLNLALPCWEWPGVLHEEGYGVLMINTVRHYAHRLAYQLHVGPIPRGWEVDHVCRNRRCWNPAHLEAVTGLENAMRGNHPLFAIARKKICWRGHDLTVEVNVYTRPDGRRRCAVCQAAGQRARAGRQAAA